MIGVSVLHPEPSHTSLATIYNFSLLGLVKDAGERSSRPLLYSNYCTEETLPR